MNQNSYAGREYLAAIKDAGIDIDVASIGDFPEINFAEEERCGGYWKPKSVETFKPYFNFYNFTSLTDEALHQLTALFHHLMNEILSCLLNLQE